MSGQEQEHQQEQRSWSEERAEIIAAKDRALYDARQAEHEQATALLREFAERFESAGIPPIPLQALPYRGDRPVRTHLRGWYLTQDRTLGMDRQGRYYILRADGGLGSRLRGADVEPALAPLVIGRGARDGETVDLRTLLSTRLSDPVRS
ncbi:hypothetical protein Bequi_03215 [Brachybacterium sp. JHP9]|uniref:Uncharacterized protein n=1 Tax=Brachybacterium equifaecis TaxID=2910770 RepID=A0ABT0QXK2_9MICO|nr:hypothetical protein [Brachybacterium equifaecis]MCL6422402.1 hypothetical protein [Brachybacterium equifaecis]